MNFRPPSMSPSANREAEGRHKHYTTERKATLSQASSAVALSVRS